MENGNTPASPLSGDAYTDFSGYDETSRTSYNPQCQGLTKREHVAIEMMKAMISNSLITGSADILHTGMVRGMSDRANLIADTLIESWEK